MSYRREGLRIGKRTEITVNLDEATARLLDRSAAEEGVSASRLARRVTGFLLIARLVHRDPQAGIAVEKQTQGQPPERQNLCFDLLFQKPNRPF